MISLIDISVGVNLVGKCQSTLIHYDCIRYWPLLFMSRYVLIQGSSCV